MREIINKNFRKYYLAIIFTVVLALFPTHPAKASCVLGWDPISSCILEGTSYFVYLMFTVVGSGIAALAGILQKVINIPVYPSGGIAVIDESWKIMRNFANMFFIVALIMMAFATIFDVLPGAAKYNARALFGRFLLTALLINFSLVLGVLVIQGTQVLNNTFLTAIGDMSGRLGQNLNPSLLIPNINATTAAQAVDHGIFGALISLIFALVLAITFLFSLLTAAIFAFIRIPILWALLVVSPIAWIMNIFPAGQDTFKKWWSTFVGWNMFLPIFLFFLYFGLYFLNSQDKVMAAIAAQVKDQKLGEGIPFTFQIVFMYVMAGIFLIGGTIVAMKASMFSGTRVVGVAGWARGVAARRLGLTAMGGAATQKLEQVKQEGLPGGLGKLYGGQAGLERQTSGWAERFGVRGAADTQLAKDVTANKKKFESVTDPAQLTALLSKGRKDERLAAAEIMKDRGLLNNTQLQQTYALYGPQTLAGKKFARSLNYDKMSAVDREGWYNSVNDIENKQKIIGVMADKRDPFMRDRGNVKKALDFFKLEGEQRDLLKKVEKYDLKMATELQIDNKLLRGKDSQLVTTLKDGLKEIVERLKPDDLLEYTSTLTKDPELIELTKGTLNKQKVEAILAKGTQNQLEAWGPLMKDTIEKMKQETNETLKKQSEATEGAVERGVRRGLGGTGGGPAGGTPPPAGPLTTGRGTGQYRGPIGFAPPTPPNPPTNPNNTVDLRNRNNP